MTDSERRDVESRIESEIRVLAPSHEQDLASFGFSVSPTRREGEYPDTAFVVEVTDRFARTREFRLAVWKAGGIERDGDGNLDFCFTALLFWTELDEALTADDTQ